MVQTTSVVLFATLALHATIPAFAAPIHNARYVFSPYAFGKYLIFSLSSENVDIAAREAKLTKTFALEGRDLSDAFARSE
jgi:hypothetical protein